MESEFQRPISGKALDSMLESLSRALDKEIKPIVQPDKQEETPLEKKRLRKISKAYFCTGINDVTRILEKMPNKSRKVDEIPAVKRLKLMETEQASGEHSITTPSALQAVIVAVDVHPRVLVKHLGQLCSSRAVPLLSISGGDGSGSLRLGQLLGLRTAMAVGIKPGTSAINLAVQSIISGNT